MLPDLTHCDCKYRIICTEHIEMFECNIGCFCSAEPTTAQASMSGYTHYALFCIETTMPLPFMQIVCVVQCHMFSFLCEPANGCGIFKSTATLFCLDFVTLTIHKHHKYLIAILAIMTYTVHAWKPSNLFNPFPASIGRPYTRHD